MIIICHVNRIDFGRNRIKTNISRGVTGWRINDAFFGRGEPHGSLRRGAPYGSPRRRVIRYLKRCLGCYADTYKQCYGACQVVAGDEREIGQRDAKRSHVVNSTTEHGVSAPQSGATHFKGRRNRNG